MQLTIQQARGLAGMTRKGMAKALGISYDTYMRIERDPQRVTIRQLNRIADVTGIAMADFYFPSDTTKVTASEAEA